MVKKHTGKKVLFSVTKIKGEEGYRLNGELVDDLYYGEGDKEVLCDELQKFLDRIDKTENARQEVRILLDK